MEQKSIINLPQGLAFGGQSAISLSGRRIPGDYQLLLEYQTNGTVYACVHKKAQAVAAVRKRVYRQVTGSQSVAKRKRLDRKTARYLKTKSFVRKDAEVEAMDGSPIDLLLCSAEADFNFTLLTSLYLDVLGRAYWFVEKGMGGQPDRLFPLLPQCMVPQMDGEGFINYWLYNVGAQREPQMLYRYGDDRATDGGVLEFRLPSLNNPLFYAQSPLAAVYTQVALSSNLLELENSWINNQARPDALLVPKGETSEDAAKRLEEKFKRKLRSIGNGGILVADSDYEYVPLTFQPKDLASLKIREETVRETCAAFDVPEPLISGNAATYANLETARRQLAEYAVAPRVYLIESVINEYLVPAFGDDNVFVAFDCPIPEDEELELKERAATTAALAVVAPYGVVSVNEMRAAADLPAIPGGDDAFAQPPTVQPPTANGPPKEPPKAEGEAKAAPIAPFDSMTLLAINAAVAKGEMPRAVGINAVAKAYSIAQDEAKGLVGFASDPKAESVSPSCGCGCDHQKAKRPNGESRPTRIGAPYADIATAVKGVFNKQRAAILKHIRKGMEIDGVVTKSLPESFTGLDEWDSDFADAVKPHIQIIAMSNADETLTRVGVDANHLTVLPAKINEAVDKATLEFAKSTNRTTTLQLDEALDLVREELREGLIEGDGVAELTRRVQDIFDNAEDYRAERIAKTEAQRAVHKGQKIAARESGVVEKFKWLASSDACPICDALDGKEIDLDGGSFGDFGYGDDDQPPAHPNCCCSMLEVLKDDSEDDSSDDASENSDDA